MSVQLYVSNLPPTITQPQLSQMFTNFTTVSTVGLFKDQSNRITGYVDFMDAREAENARLAFDGWSGFGEPLQVTHAHNYQQGTSYKRVRDDYEPIQGAQPLKQQRGANGMGIQGGYQMNSVAPEGPITQQGMPSLGAMSGYTSGSTGLGQASSYSSGQMQQGMTNGSTLGGSMGGSMVGSMAGSMAGSMGGSVGGSMGGGPVMQQMDSGGFMTDSMGMRGIQSAATTAPAPVPGARPPPYRPPAPAVPTGRTSMAPRPTALPPPSGGPMLGGGHALGAGMGTMGGAMQTNGMGHQMGGGQGVVRPMGVPPPMPPPTAPGVMGPRPPPMPPTHLPPNAVNTIHIDVLPNDVTKRELAHIFRQYEGYRHTRIVQKDSTKRKGDKITMAFIEFATPQQATFVMNKLQGYVFDLDEEGSLALKFSYAKPHTKPHSLYQSNK